MAAPRLDLGEVAELVGELAEVSETLWRAADVLRNTSVCTAEECAGCGDTRAAAAEVAACYAVSLRRDLEVFLAGGAGAGAMTATPDQARLPLPAQGELILSHLERRCSITPVEALQLYGCHRLAARIHELRQAGHTIETEPHPTLGGAMVARYRLAQGDG
jgi:hypothetical protein